MVDQDPLKESHTTEIRIVSPSQKNGASHVMSNGNKLHINGDAIAPVAFKEPHIEAPCCRDIHGKEPPDGGARAWLVMVSAFLCNGVIFGIINCYGVIHSLLTDRLAEQGDTEASSKAALVGSLTIGTTFLLSPVAGCLTDKIGLRLTTFAGGVLSAGGLFLSSFCTQNINALYLTYGVMFGFGAALAYTPTLAILGHYFKRYLGKVSGFVTAGSSVFTVILPPALGSLVKVHGLETTLQVMSFVSCFVILCSFVYKPLHPKREPPQKKPGRSRMNTVFRSIINVDIWKRKKYVIWTLCVPLALFGYFVPYVHMMKFVQSVFPGRDENLPVMCIGITSGIGRLIFGVIADLPGVNRIFLQQLSLYCIGLVTLLLPLTDSFVLLIVFALVMGLFDGCFISLLGPIAYQICGPTGATQAIGFLLGLSSLPLTVGPPIAGKIYDTTGSYTTPFILAGLPPIVGATVMFLIRFVRNESEAANEIAVKSNAVDVEEGGGGSLINELYMEKEPASNAPLMNGYTSTNGSAMVNANICTTSAANGLGLDSNGKAHLADTGIDTNCSASKRFSSALDKLYTACACDPSSNSSALLTNNNFICSKTALLSPAGKSTSSLVADDTHDADCYARSVPVTVFGNDYTQKRRYKYSIF